MHCQWTLAPSRKSGTGKSFMIHWKNYWKMSPNDYCKSLTYVLFHLLFLLSASFLDCQLHTIMIWFWDTMKTGLLDSKVCWLLYIQACRQGSTWWSDGSWGLKWNHGHLWLMIFSTLISTIKHIPLSAGTCSSLSCHSFLQTNRDYCVHCYRASCTELVLEVMCLRLPLCLFTFVRQNQNFLTSSRLQCLFCFTLFLLWVLIL